MIKMDVTRTGSRRQISDLQSTADQEQMTRILTAFCTLFPDIGYAQGMSYIVAGLLSALDYNEMHSFHTLYVLMTVYDMNTMFRQDVLGLRIKLATLEEFISTLLPELQIHLEQLDIHTSMFGLGWFNSLFMYDQRVDVKHVAHFLDVFLYAGWKFVFQLIFYMFDENLSTLEKTTNGAYVMHLLNNLPSQSKAFTSSGFKKSKSYQISNKDIDNVIKIVQGQDPTLIDSYDI